MIERDIEAFRQSVREITDELATLLPQKNLAYGNSYEVVPEMMKALYPNGIPSSQIHNALVIVRILDKLKRIVQDNDPFGENPWLDIAGYAILMMATTEKR